MWLRTLIKYVGEAFLLHVCLASWHESTCSGLNAMVEREVSEIIKKSMD